MSLKPTHRSDVKDAITRGATAVEVGTCQDENEVEGGSHNDVQEAGRDLGPVKGDDGNSARGWQLTSEVSQQFGDASIIEGESQAPLELESKRMVSTPDLLAGLSPDGHHELFVIDSQDWSVLPDELVLTLFKLMKPGDILAASQTCQLWRSLGENDKLWEHKCMEAILGYSLSAANLRALERRNKNSSIAYSAWKENFLKPYKIARKFREGVPQVITIMMNWDVNEIQFKVGNDKIVLSCRKYQNDGTEPQNIYVFCALSGKFLHELVGHTSNVEVIEIDKEFIVSGSNDGSVKVWNVDTGSCLHTLLDHTGSITCLQMHGAIAVSGSADGTLRMWNVREGMCIRIIAENIGYVDIVQFDGRLVVSGSYNCIYIWDPQSGVCLHTLDQDYSMSLMFNGVDVVASVNPYDYNVDMKVWDVNTGVCRHTLVGNSAYNDLVSELQGEILVCVDVDPTTANIWNISTGARLQTLKHGDPITGIQVNEKFVVTSSWDGAVRLWDVKTGEFIRDLMVMESGERVEKMRMEEAKIVCVVNVNGRSKLLVLNFDTDDEDFSHG